MYPDTFKQHNRTLGAPPGMDNCSSLQVYRHPTEPLLVSKWRMTWRERLSALLFGKVWVYVHASETHAPISLLVRKDIFP